MTRTVLVVGAGPAAVGAALASLEHRDVQVTVIDIGGRLEHDNADAQARMALEPPERWQPRDTATIAQLPVATAVKGLPEKRIFGSDFPFRDFGQLEGTAVFNGVHDALISGAYGGFSNIWGAQIMPFTRGTFRDWPIEIDAIYRSYSRIVREIPYAAEQDDLAQLFPLLEAYLPLPKLNERSAAVLARYARHRERLNRRGMMLGRARLAMKANDCVRCGLCLTGCPYSLIYSASHTLDRLRTSRRITYHGGLLALGIEENGNTASVAAKDLKTGRLHHFDADRVLVACGGIGTSRLVMASLGLLDTPVNVAESAQFMLPFLSVLPTTDPRESADFTLNQFNMVLDHDGEGHDVSQLHFYTYNDAFLDALPNILRSPQAQVMRGPLVKRLSVALGYLPSWASPRFVMRAHRAASSNSLPTVSFSSPARGFVRNAMLRDIVRQVTMSAPYLDLWPVLPMLRMSAQGKSYHWGGTFPHTSHPRGRFSSDTFGRVAPWTRVHLVDASVFPTVPATTFTLSVMANAHRIADSALQRLD